MHGALSPPRRWWCWALPLDSQLPIAMNSQAVDEASEEDNGEVGCVTAVGASVFGRPVWPSAFHDFVHAIDRREWVRERMTRVDFDLVGVSEEGPSVFLRDVMSRVERAWCSYAIPGDQRDNTLAALTLLHVPVRCVVVPYGGDEGDIEEEVRGSYDVCVDVGF